MNEYGDFNRWLDFEKEIYKVMVMILSFLE